MKKVIIKAPALSRSGYGEQTRFALRALRRREDILDLHLINIPWGSSGHIIEQTDERAWLESLMAKHNVHVGAKGTYDASLQITIPNEWEPLTPVNIGFTAGIETTKVAPEWIVKGNQMNRIFVVSNHSKNVYETTVCSATNNETGETIDNYSLQVPINVTNYAIRKAEPEPLELELDYDTNFLCVSQWGPRKNFDQTVRRFIEEFQHEEVGLIVKANMASDSVMDRRATSNRLAGLLHEFPERKCKLYLLHGSITEGNLAWLYTHKKILALINIAHGEGFGLPLFEAACHGMPLVTIAWGGQVDFIYAPNKNGKIRPHIAKVDYTLQPVGPQAVWEGVIQADSMWAYPDGNSYCRQLREVYKNPGRFRAQAKRLQKHILNNFSEEDMYADVLAAFWPEDVWGPLENASEYVDLEGWLENLDTEVHD
jgi:glycosyltransferase involved in cell wall biosynthesis